VKKILGILALAAAGGLAACGGSNPLLAVADVADGDADDGGGVGGDSDLPPGTASPSATGAIFRLEEGSEAQTFIYSAGTDTFTVDNMPFDGDDNLYVRVPAPAGPGDPVSTLDPGVGPAEFAVYNNAEGVNAYKMVYGVGVSTETPGESRLKFDCDWKLDS
jgi:hypothetical protein